METKQHSETLGLRRRHNAVDSVRIFLANLRVAKASDHTVELLSKGSRAWPGLAITEE